VRIPLLVSEIYGDLKSVVKNSRKQIRERTKVVNACVFNSQLAFYEVGDFLILFDTSRRIKGCVYA